jgi:hypothetical protein
MKKITSILVLIAGLVMAGTAFDQSHELEDGKGVTELSLITPNPDEGFQLAITLARKGVTETQSDREVLFALREVYSNDPDALIATSQVIAIHFQTIAAANNYWRGNELRK